MLKTDILGSHMHLIEALKLKSKLFFLFILITIGLIVIGIMGATNVNAMKKNLDSLYFGSLVPVTELNEILQTYNGTLSSTLYKGKSLEISNYQISIEIKNSLNKIKSLWNSYESHYKKNEELEYVEYVSLEISATNKYFLQLLNISQSDQDLNNISTMVLEKYTSHINSVVQKLIRYEVDMASYERKKFLIEYENATFKLTLILMLSMKSKGLMVASVQGFLESLMVLCSSCFTLSLRCVQRVRVVLVLVLSLTALHSLRVVLEVVRVR